MNIWMTEVPSYYVHTACAHARAGVRVQTASTRNCAHPHPASTTTFSAKAASQATGSAARATSASLWSTATAEASARKTYNDQISASSNGALERSARSTAGPVVERGCGCGSWRVGLIGPSGGSVIDGFRCVECGREKGCESEGVQRKGKVAP